MGRVREKRPKRKTFTGCWTCRNRKVKCDAVRPECNRCRKSNIKCEGYDVKLYWMSDADTGPPAAIKRKAMTLQGFRTWSLHLDEVDRLIAEIDSNEDPSLVSMEASNVPFNVFQVRASSPVESASEASIDEQQNVIGLGGGSGAVTETIDFESQESDIPGECDWQLQISPMRYRASISVLCSIPSILRNSTIYRLMDNYARNIATVLPPVSHPDNPYSSIYLPRALNGASNILPHLTSSVSGPIPGDIAVFYALLATSAFHLRDSDPQRGSEFDVIARRFRAKAFASLRKALPGAHQDRENLSLYSNQSSWHCRDSVMSAMLTLVTMDVIEGSMSEYWVHLGGIDKVVMQSSSGAKDSPEAQQLMTIASFLSTLAQTTATDLPSLPWTGELLRDSTLNYRRRNFSIGYGLEFTYGITPTLADQMHRIIAFSQHISYYIGNLLTIPPSLITACTHFSNELSEWSIESEPLSNLFSGTDTSLNLLLVRHHILAFTHCLRLYYHTRVLPCSSTKMQQYIHKVATHLMEIENIKAAAGYGCNAPASITWPGFIASCEAERGPPRQVWHQWWTGMLKHRIGNIATLWKVVQEAWRLKDTEGSTEIPAWMPVLRRSRQRILVV